MTSQVRGLLIALLLVLVVAAAEYLVRRNSGIPAYFQTGPEAGIYVPPSTLTCDNIMPDVLISPTANVLTDVSEAHALSLDGRSAILMQGTFDGATYYWVISDPDGYYGFASGSHAWRRG